ncbi:MAG: serine hydrolase family protein [Hydrogenophaga sp.]|uniref:RBBP9/YdeN family alpha/beta hydrolase n=1 Tax=Hydrogenophaga sp. TaxID=1904254 RepID=UPI001D1B22EE|nr:alpha/beta hydrolase [Hydrogenophaga sp.]MBX3608925.1 serine hydrolase family protein [Hydrogenophaga sp.]
MKPQNVLILPGWQNSGPEHWQSRWERSHGYHRVQQHDWMQPRRGDWMARLEDEVLAAEGPVVLLAHSLGCILTAAWAAHSQNTHRVRGALLVAPGDPEREELQPLLPSWSPIVRQRLPFPAVLVGSRDDPYCGFDRAQGLATDWGARFIDLGQAGHINADSGLGDWPQGHAWLTELMKEPR